jgi:hypothetical protein
MLQDLETFTNHLRQAPVKAGVASALRLEQPGDVADVGHGTGLALHEAGATRPESPDHHLGRQLRRRQCLQALHLSAKYGVRGLPPFGGGHALVLAADHLNGSRGLRSIVCPGRGRLAS